MGGQIQHGGGGVLWHKSGVHFSKPLLAKTELATVVAFGNASLIRTPPKPHSQLAYSLGRVSFCFREIHVSTSKHQQKHFLI